MALEADSPYVCVLFNYAQEKAAAADRILLLCQGSCSPSLRTGVNALQMTGRWGSDYFNTPLQTHRRGYCKWNGRSLYSNALDL